MKIASIAAGAAGMYCGSCIHDNTLASAMIEQGHEVALIPTYTPIRTDEHEVTIDRVFFGAVNVFLQQKFDLFQKTPRALDRWLDKPSLLSWVSKMGSSTDARDLGALTLSMLQGEDGRQAKEIEKLVDWLETFRPDIVQLTNSMFLGLAKPIKERLGVPVVCGLTGEDLFLDDLAQPYGKKVKDMLRVQAQEADHFLATSHWYRGFMADYLDLPNDRISVVPLGIKLDGYLKGTEGDHCLDAPSAEPPELRSKDSGDPSPVAIGYLARICPEKGLHQLIEAFSLLVQRWRERPSARPLELRIAGYLGPRDEAFWKQCEERIEALELGPQVTFRGEVNREDKLRFLSELDVFSVPTVYREPKGLSILEAMAQGVPVIQPNHGTFTELVQASGAGLLVEPGNPAALANQLDALLSDDQMRQQMSKAGPLHVREMHSAEQMARDTLAVYEQALRAT